MPGSIRRLTKAPPTHKIWGFCALCWSRQGSGISNDFENAVFHRHPRLGQIKRVLLREGAAEAALAGSGSAVFGVFRSPAKARRAAQAFPKDQVFVTRTLSREEYRRALLQRAIVVRGLLWLTTNSKFSAGARTQRSAKRSAIIWECRVGTPSAANSATASRASRYWKTFAEPMSLSCRPAAIRWIST